MANALNKLNEANLLAFAPQNVIGQHWILPDS